MRVQDPVTQAGYARRLAAAGTAAGLVVLADRLTKVWAESRLTESPIIVIDGWLSFEVAENTGAAFGMFRGAGTWLGVAAMVAVVIVAVALRQVIDRREVVALGLVAGGAVGNLVDRIVRGAGLLDGSVVDWIRFPNFPNFNIADSAITIGAALLILVSFLNRD